MLIAGEHFGPTYAAFHRRFRMQWKLRELNGEIVICSEFLDTPGDEITPGSDEIRKYFEHELIRHNLSLMTTADRRRQSAEA